MPEDVLVLSGPRVHTHVATRRHKQRLRELPHSVQNPSTTAWHKRTSWQCGVVHSRYKRRRRGALYSNPLTLAFRDGLKTQRYIPCGTSYAAVTNKRAVWRCIYKLGAKSSRLLKLVNPVLYVVALYLGYPM